jgi:hypothetical protein
VAAGIGSMTPQLEGIRCVNGRRELTPCGSPWPSGLPKRILIWNQRYLLHAPRRLPRPRPSSGLLHVNETTDMHTYKIIQRTAAVNNATQACRVIAIDDLSAIGSRNPIAAVGAYLAPLAGAVEHDLALYSDDAVPRAAACAAGASPVHRGPDVRPGPHAGEHCDDLASHPTPRRPVRRRPARQDPECSSVYSLIRTTGSATPRATQSSSSRLCLQNCDERELLAEHTRSARA